MSDIELLANPKAAPARRLEVFTGAGRRRAWTGEQKSEIVAESYESGGSVSAVARRHGLTPAQLFGWRRAARRQVQDGPGENASAFAPVIVEAALPCAAVPLAAAGPGGSSVIEIVIGVATVRVPLGIDVATLMTVLRAVKAAT